jgi:hypothetical protein
VITQHERAVNQAVQLLNFEPAPTPARVREVSTAVVTMLSALGGEGLDPERVATDVETRCNVFVDKPIVLENSENHREWLAARRSKIEWRFWERYRRYLGEVQGLGPRVIDRLDDVTDLILSLAEDPGRPGPWDTRGLVVGQVQSGKTGNYTGLICKAADAGYTLVVVLAGVHNSLRSQTQLRLDEGFVGFDTQRRPLFRPDNPKVGVGALADAQLHPVHALTDSGEHGDFRLKFSKQANINIRGRDPILLVVKKNASILRNLLEWSTWLADRDPGGHRRVSDVPFLLIDDEADHASVNTAKDADQDPTKINALIRRLLRSFEKSCYIGYTATPFANIYIEDRVQDDSYGEDLFPRSFIVGLRAPSNYMGPARVFGLLADPATGGQATVGLPVVRHVDDHSAWLPDRHRSTDTPADEMPASLVRALHSFILTCAARAARGQRGCHNSMLVHVTRYVRVQELVSEQIGDELRAIQNRLRFGDGTRSRRIIDDLRQLWETDFVPTSRQMEGAPSEAWEDVHPHLLDAVARIRLMRVNGSASNDVLSYVEHAEDGLSVVAVGGDKLSRGLTLEGLSVSYFLRATKMYDTLLQMGRWFGYRPGYEDLCRLYTTPPLVSWYQQITLADEELRQEFELMVARRATPRAYGLRIREHPNGLLITAPSKMRSGQTIHLSYSAVVSETVTFAPEQIASNLQATEDLLNRLGHCASVDGRYIWRGVSASTILGFLAGYRTADASATKVRADILAEYIRAREADGELIEWTVALMAGGFGRRHAIGGLDVGLTKRHWVGDHAIKRLLSPSDEELDLDSKERTRALQLTAEMAAAAGGDPPARARLSGRAIREVRPSRRGLLLLYPLERPAAGPVIGLGISFPRSARADGAAVAYRINKVMFKQLFLDLFDSEDGGE